MQIPDKNVRTSVKRDTLLETSYTPGDILCVGILIFRFVVNYTACDCNPYLLPKSYNFLHSSVMTEVVIYFFGLCVFKD